MPNSAPWRSQPGTIVGKHLAFWGLFFSCDLVGDFITWNRRCKAVVPPRAGFLVIFAILHIQPVTNEEQLREKLRKITALFEGAATAGERQAAAAAIERIRQALKTAVKTESLPETKFSMADQWQRRLFSALCRRYGLEPYRYKGQRYTTVMLRAPRAFIDLTLWPEYIELQAALHAYLNDATQRIIREEVYKDAGEATERPE
jgi:hypothetical protein